VRPQPFLFFATLYERLREQLGVAQQQFELREKQFESVLEARTLENKLLEAKYLQQVEMAKQEAEKVFFSLAKAFHKSIQKKSMSTKQATALRTQLEATLRKELEMKEQLDLYSKKFEEIQKTITKSNEVFHSLKRDLEQA